MITKSIKYFVCGCVVACGIAMTTSCKDMDDNYADYLANVPTYSPAVRNLKAVSPESGTLTLSWDIVDDTHRVKAIRILAKKTADDVQTYDIQQVVTEYTISGLELQGYEFDVYTIDGFGNLSIPVSETFTPIPGRE
ncbi:MAG: DUF4998 domain-containing protein [Bacteroidaceae bacterium]|nr:hypothetical protein [Prevotella sp.]MBR6997407.1 hypothetical protein [Prevotella sp.]MCR5432903.1 DUF4998 domain-containing protein [Bacteroidaceae bacterium]